VEKKTLISIMAAIATVLIVISVIPIPAYVWWETEASDETAEASVTVSVEGRTELLGSDGQPLKVLTIYKYGILPLSFYVGSNEVTGMRVTVSWTASGKDVDWNTLTITISASGTGGYSSSHSSSSKTGSTSFTLPISISQLGRTPSSGETVTWRMTINVKGSIKDLAGNTLTASLDNPIVNSITTKWYEPSFTISATTSTSTSGATSGGGGCGGFGKHLVWVYNIKPKINVGEILQYTAYTLIAAEAFLLLMLVRKIKCDRKEKDLNILEN